MRIIISPAKKMQVDLESGCSCTPPSFLKETRKLLTWLRGLSFEALQKLWACSPALAEENYARLRQMDLDREVTPAILAYEGIQYQYMAPAVFEDGQMDWVGERVRILSGFYGVLRPFDGVVPYRLEMQAKGAPEGSRNLYEFWGDRLIQVIFGEWAGDKMVQKGVYVKMARGEMVRYLAGKGAAKPEDMKGFCWSGYVWSPELSRDDRYVFIRDGRAE